VAGQTEYGRLAQLRTGKRDGKPACFCRLDVYLVGQARCASDLQPSLGIGISPFKAPRRSPPVARGSCALFVESRRCGSFNASAYAGFAFSVESEAIRDVWGSRDAGQNCPI